MIAFGYAQLLMWTQDNKTIAILRHL